MPVVAYFSVVQRRPAVLRKLDRFANLPTFADILFNHRPEKKYYVFCKETCL